MQPQMVEQEEEVLLEETSAATRPWASRKVLGGVVVVGLLCTAAVVPRKWASRTTVEKMAFMQAQGYGAPQQGVYGAQQGYGAGVGQGAYGAQIAEHSPAFVPFAEAQAMAAAAPQPPVTQPAPQPGGGAGLPGPYGAEQGYGAGVAHGPVGAPIAEHPEDFVAHADAPAQQGNGGGGDKPVTLNIYYETKCPFSKQFIDAEVKPAVQDPTCVFQHVHINWEPYGNVQDAGGALVCQHGADECFGNKLHLCAKKEFAGNDEALNKFITCHMEWLTSNDGEASSRAGYDHCGADAEKLTQCANDPAIFNDFRTVGQETQAAHTEHMPWAIIGNGQPNLQGMLVQGLCQQYGTGALAAFPKPACCSG